MLTNLINTILKNLIIEFNKKETIERIEKNIILPIIINCYNRFGNYIVFTLLLFILQFVMIFYILIIIIQKK